MPDLSDVNLGDMGETFRKIKSSIVSAITVYINLLWQSLPTIRSNSYEDLNLLLNILEDQRNTIKKLEKKVARKQKFITRMMAQPYIKNALSSKVVVIQVPPTDEESLNEYIKNTNSTRDTALESQTDDFDADGDGDCLRTPHVTKSQLDEELESYMKETRLQKDCKNDSD